jgi:hypothetical protein
MDPFDRARFGVLALFMIGLLQAGGALAAPSPQSPEARAKVNQVLETALGREALDQFAGTATAGCIPASSTTELCVWKLSDRESGWKPLAKAIGTIRRVALLCELPSDGSSRPPDSCSAAPQKTNKQSFVVKSPRKTGAMKRGTWTRKERQEEYKAIATAWIEEARTLVALSRLIGALPSACERVTDDSQSCVWRTNNHVYGHGTVVTWADVSHGKQVRFTCLLPLDGSGRGVGTCQAAVGS